jgi:hypothetical protein
MVCNKKEPTQIKVFKKKHMKISFNKDKCPLINIRTSQCEGSKCGSGAVLKCR